MAGLLIFVLGSLAILAVSRKSLQRQDSHGFTRLVAWELMLILFLLCRHKWFSHPFSLHQIVSWLLLFASLGLALHGAYLLQAIGKPDGSRSDETLMDFEKTTELVTIGAFRYIRHPLYGALILLTWGLFLKKAGILAFLLALGATLFLVLTGKRDEEECLAFFGEKYRDYMKTTKGFIPFLF